MEAIPSNKVVEYYVERGCKRDSPIFADVGLSKTFDDWTAINLNEKNFGIKGSLEAKIVTKSTGFGH